MRKPSRKAGPGEDLLPPALLKRFADLGPQHKVPNPIVVARYYHPVTGWEWFATAYDAASKLFHGWMSGSETSMSYFALDELLALDTFGYWVARDAEWEEMHLDEVKSYADA
jgi:hypothetical protein